MRLNYKLTDKALPCPFCTAKQRAGVHFVHDGSTLVGDYMFAITFECSICSFNMWHAYTPARPSRLSAHDLHSDATKRPVMHYLYHGTAKLTTLASLEKARDFLSGKLIVPAVVEERARYDNFVWRVTSDLIQCFRSGMT